MSSVRNRSVTLDDPGGSSAPSLTHEIASNPDEIGAGTVIAPAPTTPEDAKAPGGEGADRVSRKPVTMDTIARAANLSKGAISSVLNDREFGIRVSPKTRDRLFEICRELGYIPNDLRAMVRIHPDRGETCLLVSSRLPGGLMNPFAARITAALVGNNTGQQASLAVSLYDETCEYGPDNSLSWPLKHGIASRLIAIGATNHSICAVARHRNHPLIVLGHSAHIPGTTSIVHDYPVAAELALGLFAKHGHERVAIVGGPFSSPDPRFAEIRRGIEEVSQNVGLTIESYDISEGSINIGCALDALFSTLGRSSASTALLCQSEEVAFEILAGAQARGIAVPGQLSVAAFVDHEAAPPSCLPLTTVVLPADEMAAAAVREADDQLRSGIPRDAQRMVIGVKLVERATCGRPSR